MLSFNIGGHNDGRYPFCQPAQCT